MKKNKKKVQSLRSAVSGAMVMLSHLRAGTSVHAPCQRYTRAESRALACWSTGRFFTCACSCSPRS